MVNSKWNRIISYRISVVASFFQVVLSASSPDDEALVLGAKYFGVEFAERVDTSAILYRRRVSEQRLMATQIVPLDMGLFFVGVVIGSEGRRGDIFWRSG